MVLTDTGQLVYRYADEIFTLGRELTDVLQGYAVERLAAFDGRSPRRAAEAGCLSTPSSRR